MLEYWNQRFDKVVLLIFFNSSSNVKSGILLFIDLAQSMQSTMLKLVFPNSVKESIKSFLSGLATPLYKNNPFNFSAIICLSKVNIWKLLIKKVSAKWDGPSAVEEIIHQREKTW